MLTCMVPILHPSGVSIRCNLFYLIAVNAVFKLYFVDQTDRQPKRPTSGYERATDDIVLERFKKRFRYTTHIFPIRSNTNFSFVVGNNVVYYVLYKTAIIKHLVLFFKLSIISSVKLSFCPWLGFQDFLSVRNKHILFYKIK